ncbi:hypothetical protein B5C34_02505 [Pacificimonas flava]|uniref:Lipoprotein n=2 Tax=Pacificimonas TaxID=1960290 RepID=A0A219B2M6_9SPHN|nr:MULTISPECIES: hypothetical protein [Pacificimonas]MBZ6377908.1 hypothetical protein [Pacificimonas aurantium]OWV32434.1 hypothetical protein B5C34_02505 [Pacificimonas flava]
MRLVLLPVLLAPLILAGCGLNRNPLRVERSACPAVGVLEYAGEATLFSPAGSRDADAIDVTAAITNVRSTCFEQSDTIVSNATYEVVATRMQAAGARTVTLPVFSAVVRGGDRLLSKDIGSVTLQFADGALTASAQSSAQSSIARSAATLPDDINREIDRRRKPGDPDAAIDPLARPEVRNAVREATFEVLLGFNLDEPALAYNVAK